MKSTFALLLFTLASGQAFAAPSPDSTCRVRINGHESGMYSNENEFFSEVASASRGNRCTYGKIFHGAQSGRVYFDGRLVEDPSTGQKKGLSNAEADRAMRSVGGRCTEYSCDEVGIVRGNEPIQNELPPVIIDVPSSSEGGW